MEQKLFLMLCSFEFPVSEHPTSRMAPGSRAAPKLRLERNDPAFAIADDNNGDRSRVLDKDNAPITDSKRVAESDNCECVKRIPSALEKAEIRYLDNDAGIGVRPQQAEKG